MNAVFSFDDLIDLSEVRHDDARQWLDEMGIVVEKPKGESQWEPEPSA